MKALDHFTEVRSWLGTRDFSRDEIHQLLKNYQEQHEHPFVESNKFFATSIILASLFMLKYFGIEFSIEVFEMDLVNIPNSMFFLPILSITCLSYAAVRAVDAAYYQHLIEIISREILDDSKKVIARGYFGGGILLGNVLDVWRSLPGSAFKIWYLALASTSGLVLLVVSILPYATGIFFLFDVEPTGTPSEVLMQRAVMVFVLIAGISAGGYSLAMQSIRDGALSSSETTGS